MTDSGSEVRRADDKPGVTNLIDILSVATGEAPEAIESRYDGQGYGQFKQDVGEAVVELVAPIQQRYEELRADEGELLRMLGRRRREGGEPRPRRHSTRCTTAWASCGAAERRPQRSTSGTLRSLTRQRFAGTVEDGRVVEGVSPLREGGAWIRTRPAGRGLRRHGLRPSQPARAGQSQPMRRNCQ